MTQEDDELDVKLERALSEVLDEEFITKWLVVVESVGPDGKRGLWVQCHQDMKVWDTIGMLEFCKMVEYAREVNRDDS